MFSLAPQSRARIARAIFILVLAVVIALTSAPFSAAQKNKKKKKDTSSDDKSIVAQPEEQQIDYMISTMLGAWQLNDVERMHQCYADDATFVSGTWAPLVVGWANYVPLYQQQRARVTQVWLDRTNTYTKVDGQIAWASYQWNFSGMVDGQPMSSQGQTTLVMEKRNNRWLIVHNHTSVAQPGQTAPPGPGNTAPSQPTPGKPPSR